MQYTVLQIAQTLAPEINLSRPQVVVTSQDGTTIKMLSCIKAVCDELVKEHDWEVLTKRLTLTTVNGQSSYDWPSDVDRWLSGTFFDTTRQWPLAGPLTARQWEYIKTQNLSAGPHLRYRIFGGQIHFDPAPSEALTLVYEYISGNYAVASGFGEEKSDFTEDSDIVLFDHRLLVYGAKLKWLESIGRDTTSALTDYARALEFNKGADTPAPVIDARGSCGSVLIQSDRNIPDSLPWLA